MLGDLPHKTFFWNENKCLKTRKATVNRWPLYMQLEMIKHILLHPVQPQDNNHHRLEVLVAPHPNHIFLVED
jgi:hypothetical protein